MSQQPINTYIGTGLAFPIQLEDGKPVLSSLNDLIESSIRNILIWPFNSRYFEREFGCRLTELIEEPDISTVQHFLREFIITSLNNWENRIDLISVESFNTGFGIYEIKIKYSIKLTDTVQELTQNITL